MKKTNRRKNAEDKCKERLKSLKDELSKICDEIQASKDKLAVSNRDLSLKAREFVELYKIVRPENPRLTYPTGTGIHISVVDVPEYSTIPLLDLFHESLFKFRAAHVNIGCILMNVEVANRLFGTHYPSLNYGGFPLAVNNVIAKNQIVFVSQFPAL